MRGVGVGESKSGRVGVRKWREGERERESEKRVGREVYE